MKCEVFIFQSISLSVYTSDHHPTLQQEQEQEQEQTSAGTTVSPEFRSDSTICVATETGRYPCKSGASSVSNAASSGASVAVVGFRVGCECVC